jgi:hypothetical protein
MPLSPPVDRELSHTRAILIHGYRRNDGLYDIEASLTDTKAYDFPNEERGAIAANEPLHGMFMRMTVTEEMAISACEAVSDYTPYAICPAAAPNFARLAGLKIGRGFLKEANLRIGGTHGCTHLRELLQQMATTAFQTINPHRAKRDTEAAAKPGETISGEALDAKITERWGGPPAILGTCLAYGTTSPVVQRRWPHLYTGPATVESPSAGQVLVEADGDD